MASFLQNTTASVTKGVVDTAEKTTSAIDDNLKKVSVILVKGTPEILHVYSFDGDTRVVKEKACIPFTNPDNGGLKLSDIRQLLISEKALEPRLLSSPFTNQRGAKVADTTSFKAYLQILNEKDRTEDNADTYRVYLNSKKIIEAGHIHGLRNQGEKVAVDKSAADFPVIRQPTKPQEATTFSHNIFYNPATTFSIVHPADMSEKHWSVVMRNNCLLHAYRVVNVDGNKFVERALYPSFVLKPRNFFNYQISATAEVDSIGEAKQLLRIPRFRIDDDSYIRQFETKKSVSRAMTEASLSETDAKLAIEGGAFGYSASASASYSESKSSSSTSSSTQESRVMTITYNFPRVVIDFEPSGLDLSEECKFDLGRVNTAAAVDVFKNKYGRFFTTRVQLGGRLHNSEQSESTDAAATAKQAKSMRAAAALSFSSPWVQASASAGHSNSSDSSSEKRDASAYSAINWEAQGGDTLQCNNPPNWAYTVGSFYNWRPIHQSKIMPLEDVISMVPGYEDTKTRFAALLATKTPGPLKLETIKFRLKALSKAVFIPRANYDYARRSMLNGVLKEELAMITEERLQFLDRIQNEEFGNVPVQVWYATDGSNRDFGIVAESNEDHKLKYNREYKIQITIDGKEQWLGVNPTMPGALDQIMVWAGSSGENASYFMFISKDLGKAGEYVEDDEEFYIYLYDKHQQKLGYARSQYVDGPVLHDPGVQPQLGTNPDSGHRRSDAREFSLEYV
ncbi:hypothetical protein BP00DRAFT_472801 [Aspergillus indologenus CBS 114.80]|uniref:MACPF domain-containing protein n=1 Tax=Aspergillus indologenus CBS 114.80 TaxID=1450541 RepID=A0A2V5I8S3_9EURO|nr:hypothetical protein BP00DRAFT_472801 [Aspergillus indologenus CBS 114.80]